MARTTQQAKVKKLQLLYAVATIVVAVAAKVTFSGRVQDDLFSICHSSPSVATCRLLLFPFRFFLLHSLFFLLKLNGRVSSGSVEAN